MSKLRFFLLHFVKHNVFLRQRVEENLIEVNDLFHSRFRIDFSLYKKKCTADELKY